MRKTELSVDEIPEGHEDEYYTAEQSAYIQERFAFIKNKAKRFYITVIIGAVFGIIAAIIKIFDYFQLAFLKYVFGGITLVFLVLVLSFGIIFLKALKQFKKEAENTDKTQE